MWAKELEKQGGCKLTVVSSGHVSESLEEQVKELNAIAASGTDALILITKRLDVNNEGDDARIANAEALIARLPSEVKPGLYECQYPYKRLVTQRILDWCLSTEWFAYIKDTCCDDALIKMRCEQLKGSVFKLLNANCQTLLNLMRNGAAGYCGIMCNFHPRLYAWLGMNFQKAPQKAEWLTWLYRKRDSFPFLSAKYHMTLCGMETELMACNRPGENLNAYLKGCVEQLKVLTDYVEELL